MDRIVLHEEMLRLLGEAEREIEAIKRVIEPRRNDADGLMARLERRAAKDPSLRQRLTLLSSS